MNGRERCLAAVRGEPVDRVPVFPLLMLLAADRARITYREYATSAGALARAQLQVRDQFDLDAITACSDAFRITADLGAEMAYPEEAPPYALRPLVTEARDLLRLPRPDPSSAGSRMADRVAAVAEMHRAAGQESLVVGWVDMPFAEACSICGVSEFMLMLVLEPALAHRILQFLTGLVIEFALAQVEAGAPMIGAGDAAASLISPAMYGEFALPYEQQVSSAVHNVGGLVKLHICGNTSLLLEAMVESGCDLFNVDHMVDFQRARDVYRAAGKCYKGNVNPVTDLLQATPDHCRQRALERLRLARATPFMLSAGCEIPAGVADDVFRAFCQAPRSAEAESGTFGA